MFIKNYKNQFFRSIFHAYPCYVFKFSFFTTLDIYKDYFKGRLRCCKWMQRFYSSILWPETYVLFIFLLKKLLRLYAIGFCDQGASWSSSCGWTKELCSQHSSPVGVLVTYWDLCIDWLVTYLEPCIKRRDCHYITSPIVYWGKGSTVGWYKVWGFLYL